MKNKKLIIILSSIVGIILLCIGIFIYLLTPVGKNSKVSFTVASGDSKMQILDNLKSANLIKSKYATLLYMVVTNNLNIQAGVYDFNRNMSSPDILKSLNKGDIANKYKDEVRITFKEGLRLSDMIRLISDNTNISYDDAINELSNEEYLKELIDKYWFLTEDILDSDIYYPLEGYLFPETYQFYKDTNIKDVITKMLNVTDKKLNSIKNELNKSKNSIHEVLTIASIIEKEANTSLDRSMVSQVIYKRLNLNMSLGMDVTSYYGVRKDMSKDTLTTLDLNDKNPYNTRVTTFIGLPVGPICNASLNSITSALNPANTDYLYFVADVDTGKVYFAKDKAEFDKLVKIYIK